MAEVAMSRPQQFPLPPDARSPHRSVEPEVGLPPARGAPPPAATAAPALSPSTPLSTQVAPQTAAPTAGVVRNVLRGLAPDAMQKLGIHPTLSDIQCFGLSEDRNGQILLSGAFKNGGTIGAGHLASALNRHMMKRDRRLPRVEYISVGPADEFFIRFANGTSSFWHHDLQFVQRMAFLDPAQVRCVAFGVQGAWVIITTQYNYWGNLSCPVLEAILWATRPTMRRVDARNRFHDSSSGSDSDSGESVVSNASRVSMQSYVTTESTKDKIKAFFRGSTTPSVASTDGAGRTPLASPKPQKKKSASAYNTKRFTDGGRRNGIRFVALSPTNPSVFVVLYDNPAAQADWCVFDDQNNQMLRDLLSVQTAKDVVGVYFGPNELIVSLHRETTYPSPEHSQASSASTRVSSPAASTVAQQRLLSLETVSASKLARLRSTAAAAPQAAPATATSGPATTPNSTPAASAVNQQSSAPAVPPSASNRAAAPPSATNRASAPPVAVATASAAAPPQRGSASGRAQPQPPRGPPPSDLPEIYHKLPERLGYLPPVEPERPRPVSGLFVALREVIDAGAERNIAAAVPTRKGDIGEVVKKLLAAGVPTLWLRNEALPAWLPEHMASYLSALRQCLPIESCRMIVACEKKDQAAEMDHRTMAEKAERAFKLDLAIRKIQGGRRIVLAHDAVTLRREVVRQRGEPGREGSPTSPDATTDTAEGALVEVARSRTATDRGSSVARSRLGVTDPALEQALLDSLESAVLPGPQRRVAVMHFHGGTASYVGQMVEGKRDGWGVCTYYDSPQSDTAWFVGHWENDVPDVGLLCKRNGVLYFGCVDAYGRRHGLGTTTYTYHGDTAQDRNVLSGLWSNDAPVAGLLSYKDGRHYTGSFQRSLRHGPGFLFFPPNDDKVAFAGAFENDQYAAGPATMQYTNGTLFQGDITRGAGVKMKGPDLSPFEPTMEDSGRLEQLLQRALQFVGRMWPEGEGRLVTDTIVNWRKTRGPPCHAVSRFIRGARNLNLGDSFHTAPVIFAWHGTSALSNLYDISRDGFTTDRRKRQNQGPGEYFAVQYQDAISYCRGHDCVLLSVLLPGFHVTCLPGSCYVVNNPPTSSGVTYCLPIVAVQFDRTRLYPSPSERIAYRWQFSWQGQGKWIPYDFLINRTIATAWHKYLIKEGPQVVKFKREAMDETDVDQDYEVDFGSMLQTNLATKFQRKVTYVNVPAVPLGLQDALLQILSQL